jgi:hypothetical protein
VGGAVSGAVQAVTNVVNSTVNTVKDAVKTVGDKPLQGALKIAELPVSVPLAQVSSTANATAKIPIVGDVTKGAQGTQNILSTVEGGALPRISDVRDVAVAGGVLAGGALGGGITGAFVGDSLGKAAFSGNLGLGDLAGAALGAVGGDDGFDFGSFLGDLAGAGSSSSAGPVRTVTVHPAPTTVGVPVFMGGDGLNFTTVAILVGLAAGGYFIWKRK